jgi:hypothetical protein
MDLNSDNIIWSKGCIDNEYRLKDSETSTSVEYVKQLTGSHIVWIRNTSMKTYQPTDLDFLAECLDSIETPFILITSDGDRPVPSSYRLTTVAKLLESSKLLRWYTQNYDKSVLHPKLTYMPIGMDLHTRNWLIDGSISKKVDYMIQKRLESTSKCKDIIFSDFQLCFSHNERRNLFNQIKDNKKMCLLDRRVSFQEITDLYNKYQFVLSPRGNGLDCHRTWELFLAGAILITKTSSLDQMYRDNNLPVVILQDWSELEVDLEHKLTQWYDQYKHLTLIVNIFPKMKFSYWLSR